MSEQSIAYLEKTNVQLKEDVVQNVDYVYEQLLHKAQSNGNINLQNYLLNQEKIDMNIMLSKEMLHVSKAYKKSFSEMGYEGSEIGVLWKYVNDKMKKPEINEASINAFDMQEVYKQKERLEALDEAVTSKDVAIALTAIGGVACCAINIIPTLIGVGFLVASGCIAVDQKIKEGCCPFQKLVSKVRHTEDREPKETSVDYDILKQILDQQRKVTTTHLQNWLDSVFQLAVEACGKSE